MTEIHSDRTCCDILSEMRETHKRIMKVAEAWYGKGGNRSVNLDDLLMETLIEELQIRANKMEAALWSTKSVGRQIYNELQPGKDDWTSPDYHRIGKLLDERWDFTGDKRGYID